MNKGHFWSAPGALLLALLLAGCAGREPPPAAEVAEPISVPAQTAVPRYGMTDIYWEPPLATSPEERAAYYLSRLADPRFIAPGANGVHYVAAEQLGTIGLPAVPLLLTRLDTQNEYELMLTLYALELASRDPLLMARTGSDPIMLNDTLNPQTNSQNVAAVREWQQRHQGALMP
ncbi:hypothetical protein ACGK9R_10770 [Halomonas sp. HNIBRBA4712]|uniref:hypothetical protein n=1 Tax=Halomonas sp. HNIBRBA4712 TaxID=3373087 RepID=UPI003744BF37